MLGKKVFQIVSILLLVAICLCSCQKENPKKMEEVEEENPFDLESMKESGQNIQASFSFGVNNYDEDKSKIPYYGGELQVDFEVSPQESSFECSVLIYIDGILQEYALEPRGKTSEQHTIKIENQTKIISTYFMPRVDSAKKKHYIHFLCMFDPEYEPKEGNISYGNSHNISQVLPWELVIKENAEQSEKKIISEKMHIISKDKRKKYISETQSNTEDNRLDTSVQFEVVNGKKEGEIIFQILGGVSGKYRVSAYVGHELLELKNGVTYIDLDLDSQHMYKGSLLVRNLTEREYSTLYFVAIPISNLQTTMVQKSHSICLHGGGIQDDTNE